jgi:hypothetical protein
MLREQDVVVEVRLELPLIRGVRLGDVDEDDRRAATEPAMERFDVARPATKRRSGEAAEHEREWAPVDERRELHDLAPDQARDTEVGDRVSDAEAIRSPVARQRGDDDLSLPGLQPGDVLAVAGIQPRL